MPYLWVFLAALLVDLVPVIGPPAWTVMVLLLVKFELNPWMVLTVGVVGSVLGRYVLSLYTPWLSRRVLKREKNDQFEFVGRRLKRRMWQSWAFVFAYSVSPLPTTPLFSAAGLAQIAPVQIVPPFFVGKFISDAVMLFVGRSAFSSLSDIVHGTLSPKGILFAVLTVAIIGLFLFLDWRQLLDRKRFRFNTHIWK
jgi:uncharacterized membrane protein YdjX (TVP38/TMEM64 family)